MGKPRHTPPLRRLHLSVEAPTVELFDEFCRQRGLTRSAAMRFLLLESTVSAPPVFGPPSGNDYR